MICLFECFDHIVFLQIDNLEELLKEKDNQVDVVRARLNAFQAHHSTSEGAMTSLEDAINDKDKQISQIREQRDRAEQERNEERDIHERQIAEYKMKLHSLENEMEKLRVRCLCEWFLDVDTLTH